MTLYGGIEGGGTKFVCAIGTGPDNIVAETSFPTTKDSAETIGKAIDFFRTHSRTTPLAGVGIASFGPVDPDPRSPQYGYITTDKFSRASAGCAWCAGCF
jgi:fructokinase